MKYEIRHTDESKVDAIARYFKYFETSAALANDFQTALDSVFETLAASPLIFGEVEPGRRAVTVGKFQDVVYYSVEVELAVVVITGVIHGHRHPNVWKNRKRS